MQDVMLVTRVGALACAFPIAHVIETMRPLPVEPLGRAGAHTLALVDGVAMIRGEAVAVIDARKLLGTATGPAARIVVVRTADHRLAVTVDEVVGVRSFDRATLAPLPPLMRDASRAWVSSIAARKSGLLIVLDSARLLSEDGWQVLAAAAEPPAAEPKLPEPTELAELRRTP